MRSVQKHGPKETCNLLQQAGVRDSCRLEKEKKTQWGENANLRTTEKYRPLDHRTGSMFAVCKAWIEGNLQPSSASRGERFLQAGRREKNPVKKKCQPQNHREILSAEPPKDVGSEASEERSVVSRLIVVNEYVGTCEETGVSSK